MRSGEKALLAKVTQTKHPYKKCYYIDTGSKGPLDKKKELKKMVTIVLLVVLFFRPILRAVGLINEALNAGLDRAENKIKTEVK